jgi:hypothetical protein
MLNSQTVYQLTIDSTGVTFGYHTQYVEWVRKRKLHLL